MNLKNQNLITKNMRTLKGIYYILNNNGACSIEYCNPCTFNTSNSYSINENCCVFSDVFSVRNKSDVFSVRNKIGPGSCYSHCKIYYCLMLLTLYTNAEKLTYSIQGEFDGTNT